MNELKCFKCTYTTTRSHNLKRHVKNKHDRINRLEKVFLCEHCDYRNKSKFKLKRHMLVHFSTIEKRKKHCPVCFNDFDSRSAVNKHLTSEHNVAIKEEKLVFESEIGKIF